MEIPFYCGPEVKSQIKLSSDHRLLVSMVQLTAVLRPKCSNLRMRMRGVPVINIIRTFQNTL